MSSKAYDKLLVSFLEQWNLSETKYNKDFTTKWNENVEMILSEASGRSRRLTRWAETGLSLHVQNLVSYQNKADVQGENLFGL